MNDDTQDARLEDLEARIAFQEQSIETLSDALAAQQATIETLRRQLDHLSVRFRDMSDTLSNIDPSHEPPPHY